MRERERVVEYRLRCDTEVTENQVGFISGKSTMEAICSLQKWMKMFREQHIDLNMVFIDLEKAYDRVHKEVL